ncbi:hypothetical protein [Chryseobacterium elymi]|nr:hypothetical protein [Chryseobacterium elymi]
MSFLLSDTFNPAQPAFPYRNPRRNGNKNDQADGEGQYSEDHQQKNLY